MQNPLVSVIIPCFNAASYMEDSLMSIVNQTYKNIEIIAIDDCSSDNTWSILQSLQKKDHRIKIYQNPKNLKLISTLNRAIDFCQGDFIARMDADDISNLDRIEKQVKVITENEELDFVSVFPIMINYKGKFHSKQRHFYCTSTGSAKFKSMFESPILHAAILIKSEILKNNKYIFKNEFVHIEDFELWIRLLNEKNFKFKGISEELYKYRVNQESVSYLHREIQYKNHLELSREMLQKYYNIKIEDVHIKIILLRVLDRNILASDFVEAIKLFNFLKIDFFKKNNELNHIDKKEIIRWTQQRIIRICFYFLIKGSFKSKIFALYIILLQISAFKYLITYKNCISRFQWLISNLKFKRWSII
jgi:glycosyltransferase involved in cell wall biosynthesis